MKALRCTIALLALALTAACSGDVTGPGDSIRANNSGVMGSPG